jgi:hypothetical protein
MVRRPIRLTCRFLVAGTFLTVLPASTSAQAFVPSAGEGNATATYQHTYTRGHLTNGGELFTGSEKTFAEDPDIVRAHSLLWDFEYGVTDRLAVNVSLPYIAAKYQGTDPHLLGIHGTPSTLDDGTFHGTVQDVHAGIRFNLRARPLAITPLVEVIIPSHHYESLGHSVVGLDLRALVVGVATAGFIDALPGTYFQTQVSHAVVEQVLGIRPNRSRLDSEVGYFVTPRFAVRFLESFQMTHDGLDFYVGPVGRIHSTNAPLPSFDYYLNHDRLERISFLNLGGGILFAPNDSVDLFAAGSTLVWGRNIHPPRGISVGANFHFRTQRTRGPQPSQRPMPPLY